MPAALARCAFSHTSNGFPLQCLRPTPDWETATTPSTRCNGACQLKSCGAPSCRRRLLLCTHCAPKKRNISRAQIVFYTLTVILVASFILCAFVGHSFKTGSFPWVRDRQADHMGARTLLLSWADCAAQPATLVVCTALLPSPLLPCCVRRSCSCGPSRCSRWRSASSSRRV